MRTLVLGLIRNQSFAAATLTGQPMWPDGETFRDRSLAEATLQVKQVRLDA